MDYEITATGVKITAWTDVPCHLWMRWTNVPWDVHLVSELVRGYQFRDVPYYCLVAYDDNEQKNAGDTLFHIFVKEPWAVCETRYFYFWGIIDGQFSPSETCFFEYHRTQPTEPTCVTFDAVRHTGYLLKYGATWAAAWSAAIGGPVMGAGYYEVMARRPSKPPLTICRGILRFDTSALPDGCSIVSATLKIAWFRNVYPYYTSQICFVEAIGCGDALVVEDYGYLRPNTTQICSPISIPPLVLDTYYEKALNATGLSLISTTGQSRIGIRAIKDIDNIEPVKTTRMWASWYGDEDVMGIGVKAQLVVCYT